MPDLTPVQSLIGIIGLLAGGGFLSTVWTTVTGTRGRKVDEAASITEVVVALRKEMREENADLRSRMEIIVRALNSLTNCWDDLSHKISGLTPEERARLRQANNEAKIAA